MSKHCDTDVLIVGSGAAGSLMALELARHGIVARNVDRLPSPSTHSRAITVHARSLEMLERIDPELLRRFTARGIRCPGYVIHYSNEQGQRSEVRPGLDFTTLDSHYPYLLLHRQDETEQTLRDFLAERYGRSPEWGVSCEEITLTREGEGKGNNKGVEARLRHADGSEESIHARYVVACDGANSRIRRALNLSGDSEGDYGGAVLQNLDVELLDFPDLEEWVHYCVGPGHFVMVAKLPGGFYRLLMSQPPDKADMEATPQDIFGDILARHFDGIRFGSIHWHSRWQSQVRLAHTYRQGNVFLVGDAAHVHSTAGGQGMNCCLQDSYNLAWKLAMVIKGKAAPVLLDSYEQERKPIGAQVIDAASQIHELFMAGRKNNPDEFQALCDSGFTAGLVGRVSGLTYHYRPADSAELPGLTAGDRAPDAMLEVRGQGHHVYELTRHTGFTLLITGEESQLSSALKSSAMALGRRFPDLLQIQFMSPAPKPYPAMDLAGLYLIRPDGYLAFTGNADDFSRLGQWLDEFVAGS